MLAKLLGGVWLATAIAFLTTAIAVWARASWWLPFTLGTAAVSLVLSALYYPDSRIGMPLNLCILILLLAVFHGGGLGAYN